MVLDCVLYNTKRNINKEKKGINSKLNIMGAVQIRLYFKFIVLGIILETFFSLLIPNLGFLLGGLLVGYLVADNYLEGALNACISQLISGILVVLFIPFLMKAFLNESGFSLSSPSNYMIYIIFMGIESAIIGLIMGFVFGIVGVYINKSLKKTNDIDKMN
jgi:hypothetical protein